MSLRLFAAIALFAITGCSTPGGSKVTGLDRSLLELQSIATKSMPLGLRKTSSNGREYFSNYFIVDGRKFKPAEKSGTRRYAHILVLGDRRPYDMQIIVNIETATDGQGYQDAGRDEGLAAVIKKRVAQQLNKRREDMNIIDDFRVF